VLYKYYPTVFKFHTLGSILHKGIINLYIHLLCRPPTWNQRKWWAGARNASKHLQRNVKVRDHLGS